MKVHDTDLLAITKDVRDWLAEHTERQDPVTGCMVFRTLYRHVDVRLRNYSEQHALVHVRRVAYAVAHRCEAGDAGHVGSDERVVNTCQTIGNPNTGDGMCINPAHLAKRPAKSEIKEAA